MPRDIRGTGSWSFRACVPKLELGNERKSESMGTSESLGKSESPFFKVGSGEFSFEFCAKFEFSDNL